MGYFLPKTFFRIKCSDNVESTVGYPLLKYIAGSELHWIGDISAVRGHFPGAQSGRPSAELEFISLIYLIQAL